MELLLNSRPSKGLTTIGKMYVDGVYQCLTLEDQVRVDDPNTPENEGKKVMKETAIPAGRYRVTITYSPKFKKFMMLINDVPDFTGIRIHSGNTKEDTEGCVTVGTTEDSITRIHGGTVALPALFNKVQAALNRKEEVWITVNRGVE